MDVDKEQPDANPEWEFDPAFKSDHEGLKSAFKVFGPAFIAAIAYVDPGNFATNFSGGSSDGYRLLWVVSAANLVAMFVQMQSMRLGLATGTDLPSLCRKHYSRRVVVFLWLQAVIVAMATDLAEFVGAAIALNMLFGIPLFVAGLATGGVSFWILKQNQDNRRGYESTMVAVMAVILLGFVYDMLDIHVNWGETARGFAPGFAGQGSILLACGIFGATVMPHVIYLHSEVAKGRAVAGKTARRRIFGLLKIDVFVAMSVASVINMFMLIVAAALFHHSGQQVSTLQQAHTGIARTLGQGASTAFALTLLVSGLASSSVGTHAGQVVMEGFMNINLTKKAIRAIIMTPSLAILMLGLNPTRALVISQVVLSFGIPFALFPLVRLTSKSDIMGELVNKRTVTVLGYVLSLAITLLNGFLFWSVL